jgi:hypothetical protein
VVEPRHHHVVRGRTSGRFDVGGFGRVSVAHPSESTSPAVRGEGRHLREAAWSRQTPA